MTKKAYLLLLLIWPCFVYCQADNFSMEQFGKVLNGYSNRFANFPKGEKLETGAVRLIVQPGLIGPIDALDNWNDSTYIYVSAMETNVNFNEAITFANKLDSFVQKVLKGNFERSTSNNLLEDTSTIFEYHKDIVTIKIKITRYEETYSIMLLFRGTIR
jgi:hypothetical protein